MATLAEFFGKTDVVEDCRKLVQSRGFGVRAPRIIAELNLGDGNKRYFRCRSTNRSEALQEVAMVVAAIKEKTGDPVLWRFTGEDFYRFDSTIEHESSSFVAKTKHKFMEFFDLA
ncbi:DUF6018 family natural product bioysynthesis protein [Bacillus alkalicellulosilyticus]|uniref:DUF6018 family natural product bioysynthesis protein n=1 Tax=Alkalihalobacterium alkalicellulosilyticum TaxID=1912214 RepID=UPI00099638E3|nr:DUF6018 family natural product bioysynthesis protein [Bacillus alkalicellulosilyticus]